MQDMEKVVCSKTPVADGMVCIPTQRLDDLAQTEQRYEIAVRGIRQMLKKATCRRRHGCFWSCWGRMYLGYRKEGRKKLMYKRTSHRTLKTYGRQCEGCGCSLDPGEGRLCEDCQEEQEKKAGDRHAASKRPLIAL